MRIKHLFTLCAAVAALLAPRAASAQNVGIKTNLINDIALSPNIGVEVGVAPKWTLELDAELNLWKVDGRSWKHAYLMPEARYWLCQRFAGHFFALHAIGGTYNFGNLNIPIDFLGSNYHKLKDQRYQGWAAGAGIAYGYAWPVHKHWNIEAEIGIGWMYTRFDSYPCAVCGTKLDNNKPHNYFGPTKFAVNVEYIF